MVLVVAALAGCVGPQLNIQITGDGSGVISSADGMRCDESCWTLVDGSIALSATANPGSTFVGWTGGGCAGTQTCTLAPRGDMTVTAEFATTTQTLAVALDGAGAGSVSSTPEGIACGDDCTEAYRDGTAVTLTAKPGDHSMFTGWTGGGCSGTGPCRTTVEAATTIHATFALAAYSVSVTPLGTGSGTIESVLPGIACGADCTEAYPYGTMVTVHATPAPGSAFLGWGASCTGTGTCSVSVDGTLAITARFEQTHTLSVVRNGGGSVRSDLPGIDCGGDCSDSYPSTTQITLTATPSAGATFLGWSGWCIGTSPTCTLSMDAEKTVTASFSTPPCMTFAALAKPAVGTYPDGMDTNDFNGDGKPDLAVGNHDSATVSVLLGKGDGTFQTKLDYAVGGWPFGVRAGDFNGDGKADVAVANLYSIAVLLGNGDGTLVTAVDYNTGGNPQELTVGDVNADGKLDLVVSNANNGPLSILLGNGNGTFLLAANYTVGPYPSGTAIGDYNRDGKVDLAVAIANGQHIELLLGNGNGSFQPPVVISIPTQGGPYDIATKDLDGDGKLDLVAAGTTSGITVLRGNGDGTFQTPVNYAVALGAFSVSVADIDGDGIVDIVAASPGTDSYVGVLRGNGNATFQAPVLYPTGSDPEVVVTADFDGDHRLDIATADRWQGTTLTVLRNTSTCGL